MQHSHHHVPLGTVAVSTASGALIALQSRANGGLSHALGNPFETAVISFGSGLLLLVIAALSSQRVRAGLRRIRAAVRAGALPRWQLLAGTGGATFVMVQAYVVPRVGVAILSVASIAGQSIASLVVDRVGLRAGVRHALSGRRIIAAVIACLAVFMSVTDRLSGGFGALAALVVAAGSIVAVQRALNAHITDHSANSYATTLVNFATGTSLLVVVNLVTVRDFVRPSLASTEWWMYTGGAIGVLYIALFAVVVQRIGVLMSTVTSVGGQLLGSLLLDLRYPTHGVQLGANVYLGVVVSFVGILVGVMRPRGTRKNT